MKVVKVKCREYSIQTRVRARTPRCGFQRAIDQDNLSYTNQNHKLIFTRQWKYSYKTFCFRLRFISFDPPGVMSAGLTCDFAVTFKPMVSFKSLHSELISFDIVERLTWHCERVFFSYYTLVQLNEDLVGHIDFLAQTGPFSVPIRCVTKKCQVLFFSIFTVILI